MNQTMAQSAESSSGIAGVVHRNCPHCDGAGFEKSEMYSQDEWTVGRCTDCDFVFLRNVPEYDRMIEEFAWESTYTKEHQQRLKKRPVAKRVSAALRTTFRRLRPTEAQIFTKLFKPGPVLDVGCAGGKALPDGFTPYGVELSRGLHARADTNMRQAGGHCVHAPAVEGIAQFDDSFFSGIILRSFLEHEWQPKKLLENAHQVLRDDGGVFVRVPNFASYNRRFQGAKWCGFRYPDHVNYFTPDSLRKMASDCGFDMRILFPLNVAFDDNIKAVLTKKSQSNGALH